jgi:hypothetical protein
MSERETSIRPRDREKIDPGNLRGMAIAEYGRVSRVEMIQRYRDYHQRRKANAEAALALHDDELIVETYRGPYARKGLEEVTA